MILAGDKLSLTEDLKDTRIDSDVERQKHSSYFFGYERLLQ
jgi:hypothetical protein